MEQRSNFFSALILVVLGIVVHSYSLNLSPNIPSANASLLPVFKGVVLLPTISNLLFIKVSLFFLLWGFLKVFSQLGKPVGGLSGALLLAVYPLLAVNSGELGVFVFVLALFWWSVVLAYRAHNVSAYLLPFAIVLLCSYFITPWMLMLSGILVILSYERVKQGKRDRLIAICMSLFMIVSLLLILILPFFQRLENYILFHEQYTWLRRFLTMGITFDLIYSWGAAVLICFGGFAAIRVYPKAISFFILCLGGILFVIGLDLGGIVVLWIVFATLLAFAFDSIWSYFKTHGMVWISNVLIIIFVVCVFNIDPDKHLYSIMQAQKINKNNFQYRCGSFVKRPQLSSDKLVVVSPESPGNEEGKGCWVAFGNNQYALPGRYRATFFVCHEGAVDSFVDVWQGHGQKILGREEISEVSMATDCTESLSAIEIEYDVTEKLSGPVEHRVFYGNKGTLYFDRVEVEFVDGSLW